MEDNNEFFEELEISSSKDVTPNNNVEKIWDTLPFVAGASLATTILEDENEAERTLKELSEEDEDEKIERIPLSARHETATNTTSRPILRWFKELFSGKKKLHDPISYTDQEMMKILDEEGKNEK